MSVLSVLVRMHFVFGLIMFLFVALIVVEDDMQKRALMLVPVIITDLVAKVMYSLDQIERLEIVLEKVTGKDRQSFTSRTSSSSYHNPEGPQESPLLKNLAKACCRSSIHCSSFAMA